MDIGDKNEVKLRKFWESQYFMEFSQYIPVAAQKLVKMINRENEGRHSFLKRKYNA